MTTTANQTDVEKTILHLIDTTGPGGAETVFATLLKEFAQTNSKNIVVLRGEGWVADKVRLIGIEPHIIDSKGSFNLTYIRALRKLVTDEQVDLIHAHLLGSNVYGALLALICRKPMIATFHGAVDVAARERFLKAKFLIIGLGASKIVCVSKRLESELAARSSLPSRKLKLIYNGVDPTPISIGTKTDLRQELGLPSCSTLVISIGNIRPAKGYEYLIDAAIGISETDPDIHFLVIGHQRETLFKQLKERTSKAASPPHIHWLGFREDVAAILRQADIFLLPSVSEGFSIATVEAMMAGVPVIATKSGGPEEIIVDGETGFLIPTRDASAIVEAIRTLKASALRTRLTERANIVAVEKFGLANMLAEYRGLYRQLTS
ncbi:glycosyltransferase family 4 protein [Marinobacter apostichopi]|uniref:glycosyltransferase family 4 protein n=1 Tax=Marinobacter apostichopi TaxID=3035454 RepID=UPI002572A18B|nr:glycosyltransferase family 4 protein [Marinobacter sp. LA51]